MDSFLFRSLFNVHFTLITFAVGDGLILPLEVDFTIFDRVCIFSVKTDKICAKLIIFYVYAVKCIDR